MGWKRREPTRTLLFLIAVPLGMLLVWMAGCDKITSTFRAIRKSVTAKKEHGAVREPKRRVVPPGPKLAIILDDLGSDRDAAEAIFSLREPLTISVLPFHSHSTEIAEEARRQGVEVMLHLPMQAVGNELPEAQQLHSGMSEREVAGELSRMLANVPTAVGVNNHEGSLATTDGKLMGELMPLLRQRSLYFVDSRTTAATVAFNTAQQAGLRCGFRNVPFLDDVEDLAAIRKQLQLAIHGAEEKGSAIAIGHPHKQTLEALRELLPEAEATGVHLVVVSEALH